MTEASISTALLNNAELQERLQSVLNEVACFAKEVGAPSLPEALARFKRFASIAVELQPRVEGLTENIKAISASNAQLAARIDAGNSVNRNLQVRIASLNTEISALKAQIHTASAAMRLCADLLNDPMFSGFVKETKGARDALRQAMNNNNVQEIEDAPLSS